MKKFVTFKIIPNQGNVTLDFYNPIFQQSELKDILDKWIPYTRLFEKVIIKNCRFFDEILLNRLTNQYLHGAEIIVENKGFAKSYKAPRSKKFYNYVWSDLDMTKPVPKSLAEYIVKLDDGTEFTYLNALKYFGVKPNGFIPAPIWSAIDKYSADRIALCREYNKGTYEFAEDWYRELQIDCLRNNLRMQSPNAKTYYESIAQLEFENSFETLAQGLRPLNASEKAFLHRYAPAYGVDVQTFDYRYNTRLTKDGYTQEPERTCTSLSASEWNRILFDPKHPENNLPKGIRQNLNIRSNENEKLMRDAYFNLKWLMKNLKDDALMPNWHRCPKCHKLYREIDGCECGYCQPVEFINADNLFYGCSSTYEDYDSTKSAYEDLD